MERKSPEQETRKKIDLMLGKSGWEVIKFGNTIPKKGAFAVKEYPTKSGPVDYALVIDSDIVGLVEAKKEMEAVYSVLTQAQRYARDIENTDFDFNEFKSLLYILLIIEIPIFKI